MEAVPIRKVKRLTGVLLGSLLIGETVVTAEQPSAIEIAEQSVTHSYLVPNKSVKIEQEHVEDFNGIPVVIGIGSDGKGYFSPDLFPEFDPNNIQAIGQIGKRIVMITKKGEAFYLGYRPEVAAYSSTALGNGPVRIANAPASPVLIRPVSIAGAATANALRVRETKQPDTDYTNGCPNSTSYARAKTLANAHANYLSARAEDGTIDLKKLQAAYAGFARHASDTGSPESLRFQAQMLYLGEVEKDYAKSIELFKQAMKNESASAQWRTRAKYAIASMLLEGGKGLEVNRSEALVLLKEIKNDRGHASIVTYTAACLLLAEANARGLGTTVDLAMTTKYIDEINEVGGPIKLQAARLAADLNQIKLSMTR